MARQWPFFGKKQPEPEPEPEPVRPEQVERLANLLAEEDDAILFDAPGSPYYAESQALLEAALRHSTDAELRAARALRYQESKDGPGHDLRRPSTPKPPPPPAVPTNSHPTPSSAPADTSTGGTAMSSIEEVRAALLLAIEKAEQTAAALIHSQLEIDQIDVLLQTADGSSRNEHYHQGAMAFLKAQQELRPITQLVRSGMDNLAEYAHQL